jgi:hypothetical protein
MLVAVWHTTRSWAACSAVLAVRDGTTCQANPEGAEVSIWGET